MGATTSAAVQGTGAVRALRAAASWRWPGGGRALPLMVLLLVASLVPIWTFDYFLSQDGPAHLYNVQVLLDYGDPARTAYREYFQASVRPLPNLLGHLTLGGFMLVASPRTAERLLLSVHLLLFVGGLLYALRAVRPEPGFAWLIPFVLVQHFPLHMGFYSFTLGSALSLFVVGYVLVPRPRFGTRGTLALAGLLVILYFAHLAVLLMAVLAIGVLSMVRLHRVARSHAAGQDAAGAAPDDAIMAPLIASLPATSLAAIYLLWDYPLLAVATILMLAAAVAATVLAVRTVASGSSDTGAWMRRVAASRLFMPLVVLLPAAVALWLAHSAPAVLGEVWPGPGLVQRLREIWGLDALVSLARMEIQLAFALSALLVAAIILGTVRAARRRERVDPWGLSWVVLAFAALYMTAPAGLAEGGYILARVDLFLLVFATIWVGGMAQRRDLDATARWAVALVMLGFLVLRVAKYAELDPRIRAYVEAGDSVAEGATLLTLPYGPYGVARDGSARSVRVQPFLHAGGHIGMRRHAVLLDNYEAVAGYFPVRYRPSHDPGEFIGELFHPSLRAINLLSYSRRSRGRIDYVLVWNPGPPRWDWGLAAVLAQLHAAFEPVLAEPGQEELLLYRSGEEGSP